MGFFDSVLSPPEVEPRPRRGSDEALWSLLSGAIAMPVAGAAGVMGAIGPGPPGQGADWTQRVQEAMTYVPRSEQGKQTLDTITYPFQKLAEFGDYAGGQVSDQYGPAAGAAVNALIQGGLPMLLGPLGKGIAREARAGTLGKGVTPGSPAAQRGMFLGPDSLTADLPELDEAIALAALTGKDKLSMDQIRDQTGWFRDKGGKWQYEISDKEARFEPHAELERQRQAHMDQSKTLDQARYIRAEMDATGMSAEEAARRYVAMYTMHAEKSGGMGFVPKYDQAAVDMANSTPLKRLDRDAVQHERKWPEMENLRTTLGNVYWHPELYKAYPWLMDEPLSLKSHENPYDLIPLQRGARGQQHASGIDLHNELANTFDQTGLLQEGRSVASHEVQHAIGAHEGFSRGASPFEFYPGGKYEPPIRKLREKGEQEYERLTDLIRAYTGAPDSVRIPLMNEQYFLSKKLKNLEPFEVYQRALGEAQARATQRRLDMTMEERKASRIKDIYDRPEETLWNRPQRAGKLPIQPSAAVDEPPPPSNILDFNKAWEEKIKAAREQEKLDAAKYDKGNPFRVSDPADFSAQEKLKAMDVWWEKLRKGEVDTPEHQKFLNDPSYSKFDAAQWRKDYPAQFRVGEPVVYQGKLGHILRAESAWGQTMPVVRFVDGSEGPIHQHYLSRPPDPKLLK